MELLIVFIALIAVWAVCRLFVVDGQLVRDHGEIRLTASAAITSRQIRQLPDGRCAIYTGDKALVSGDEVAWRTSGLFLIEKSTSVNFLPGQEIWWDSTNGYATYALAGSYFVGICAEDDTVAAATTQVLVDLNVKPYYLIDIDRDGYDCAIVTTAGSPTLTREGGPYAIDIAANDEAEKVDMLSRDSIAIAGRGIFEGVVNVIAASNAALDINVGIANATHASSADTIAEAVFIHIDGNSLNILAESDDGTTEVAATDTTVNYALGTAFFWQIDARDAEDIQIYINGANVLAASVFALADGTGPMKLLAHVEKSGGADADEVHVEKMRGWVAPAA